jgi:hypothetical protein
MRARRIAVDIQHPKGYKGMVMWCSTCRAELMRSPATRTVPLTVQQAAVDAHVCELRNAPRLAKTRRRIERGARRIMHRAWLYRWRWHLVAVGVAILTMAAWLIVSRCGP